MRIYYHDSDYWEKLEQSKKNWKKVLKKIREEESKEENSLDNKIRFMMDKYQPIIKYQGTMLNEYLIGKN